MNNRKFWQMLTVAVFLTSSVAMAFAESPELAFGEFPELGVKTEAASSVEQRPTNPCNPCAKKKTQNPGNPCAKKSQNPCNPCAKKKTQNPCNPCAKKSQNPCNPCAGKKPSGEVYAPAVSYRKWMKVNSKPFVSQGHSDVFVTAYANPTAQKSINSKSQSFPEGSIIIKESFANANGKPGERGTIFGMEKTGNGWLWVTTDATGHVTGKGDSKQMQMCAQCHAAAQTDLAFLRRK